MAMSNLVLRSVRFNDHDLAEQHRIEISNQSVELCGINSREATYIQTYPLVNGPDLNLNRHLWSKLASADVWRVSIREREELTIEIQEVASLPPFPDNWRVPGKSAQELREAYAVTIWALQFVPEGPARILQAGSMTGHEPLLMKSLDPSRRIMAIDLLLDCSRNIKKAGLDVSVGSLFELPLSSESFDCVYNNNVMEHLYNEVDTAIAEIYRVLKPGGIFSFVIPIEANPSNPDLAFQTARLGKSRNWWLVDPSHPWKTDLYDINYRMKRTGFQNIRFVFRSEDLQASAKRKNNSMNRNGIFPRFSEKVYLAFEESLFFHELESRTRKLLNFYRFGAYRQRLHDWLGLPNRHVETLQVLVFAQKPLE